jgi:hypothetical protein
MPLDCIRSVQYSRIVDVLDVFKVAGVGLGLRKAVCRQSDTNLFYFEEVLALRVKHSLNSHTLVRSRPLNHKRKAVRRDQRDVLGWRGHGGRDAAHTLVDVGARIKTCSEDE